jgi:hypothetical protein
MELPQSTAKVGPDPPWWGVGVHWTGAVFWGASTAYDLFARKDRRGRGTKLRPCHLYRPAAAGQRQGPGQLCGIVMPPPRRRLIFCPLFFKEKKLYELSSAILGRKHQKQRLGVYRITTSMGSIVLFQLLRGPVWHNATARQGQVSLAGSSSRNRGHRATTRAWSSPYDRLAKELHILFRR